MTMNTVCPPAHPATCVGRWCEILYRDMRHAGTVIDHIAGEDTPKRVRIQRGPMQGDVVQLGEYEFMGWLEETEIDP